jgi:hypothetical protein
MRSLLYGRVYQNAPIACNCAIRYRTATIDCSQSNKNSTVRYVSADHSILFQMMMLCTRDSTMKWTFREERQPLTFHSPRDWKCRKHIAPRTHTSFLFSFHKICVKIPRVSWDPDGSLCQPLRSPRDPVSDSRHMCMATETTALRGMRLFLHVDA